MTVKFTPLLTSSYRENIANQEKDATKGLLRTVLEDFKAHSGTKWSSVGLRRGGEYEVNYETSTRVWTVSLLPFKDIDF